MLLVLHKKTKNMLDFSEETLYRKHLNDFLCGCNLAKDLKDNISMLKISGTNYLPDCIGSTNHLLMDHFLNVNCFFLFWWVLK